jgi:hypothetical protein
MTLSAFEFELDAEMKGLDKPISVLAGRFPV